MFFELLPFSPNGAHPSYYSFGLTLTQNQVIFLVLARALTGVADFHSFSPILQNYVVFIRPHEVVLNTCPLPQENHQTTKFSMLHACPCFKPRSFALDQPWTETINSVLQNRTVYKSPLPDGELTMSVSKLRTYYGK
jgi:hypothetical protein